MAVMLYQAGYEQARRLIIEGHVVLDVRDDWSEHQPSTQEENKFIQEHGIAAYARWHLCVDDTKPEESKARYKFPYGDFVNVHRCAILTAESRAGQYKYYDIELAIAHLHGMLEILAAKR